MGEAPDGNSGLAAVRCLRPEVVLLDVQLPDVDGFDLAARLSGEGHDAAVVMTSSRDDFDSELISGSGARGFLRKHELTGPALAAVLR